MVYSPTEIVNGHLRPIEVSVTSGPVRPKRSRRFKNSDMRNDRIFNNVYGYSKTNVLNLNSYKWYNDSFLTVSPLSFMVNKSFGSTRRIHLTQSSRDLSQGIPFVSLQKKLSPKGGVQ